MAVDRPDALACCARRSPGSWPALVICGGVPAATAQEPERPKAPSGFAEGRRGDIPEGTLEMMTPETDRAIQSGLAWLARNQNADGSFGSGTYRGNIAVTSVAGLAFMSSGSSPGRGPYGGADRQGAGLRHGEHLAVGLHLGAAAPRRTGRCTRTASARCSWPRPTA